MIDHSTAIRPLFIDGAKGPLFALHTTPEPGSPARGDLVFVPPFAEEMNLSRRMAAVQARRLAEQGIGVLQLDLYGTGDSAGDFSEARWEIWLDDIGAALDWLAAQGRRPIGLWGLRLGALLALDLAGRRQVPIERAILWQPVTDGRRMLSQFLRLRVAAQMDQAEARDDSQALRRGLAEGGPLEIAGYLLAPELAAAIEQASLGALRPPAGCRVDWFQLLPSDDAPLPPAVARLVEDWTGQGAQVTLTTVVGEQFWSVQSWERSIEVPALWDATLAAFAEPAP